MPFLSSHRALHPWAGLDPRSGLKCSPPTLGKNPPADKDGPPAKDVSPSRIFDSIGSTYSEAAPVASRYNFGPYVANAFSPQFP